MHLIRDKITDIQVRDTSDLGICCTNAVRLAEELGFNLGDSEDIASLAADMISHMLSHGCDEGRFFVCRILDSNQRQGLEMWSCDNGDAISDVLNDVENWSIAHSLPEFEPTALQRLSDEYGINPNWWPDFITVPGGEDEGSWIRIFSRKWRNSVPVLMG